MNGIQEQVRYSIEERIREHLDQDVDRDSAIYCASVDIVNMLIRNIEPLGHAAPLKH